MLEMGDAVSLPSFGFGIDRFKGTVLMFKLIYISVVLQIGKGFGIA